MVTSSSDHSDSSDPDLGALRREYGNAGLDDPDLAPDPVAMFRGWLADTVASGLHEPNAMVVSTVSASGTPSSRMVLLKGLDERGFVFYSNLESRKGRELGENPRCALLFPWHDLQRQVRVEGVAELVEPEQTEVYFRSRPRGSQIGAWASRQSTEVASRAELEQAYAEMERRFEGGEVPLPPYWGGLRVRPEVVEFWQGRHGRMHDRLVYRRDGAADWTTARLAP